MKPLELGVDLFFTLSGFIFMLICDSGNKQIIYSKFIYNRFLRIFPLLLFLYFTVIAVMSPKFKGADIFHIIFLNIPGDTGKFSWGDHYLSVPWWTVSVEFLFYLIFPFLIRFYKKYGVTYFIKLILLIIITRYIIVATRGPEDGYGAVIMKVHFSIIGHLDTFLFGMLAAELYRFKDNFK